MTKFDVVEKAKHYNQHPSGVECIDLAYDLNGNMFSALKYIWRHKLKDNAEQDLRKAIRYLEQEKRGQQGSILPDLGMVHDAEKDPFVKLMFFNFIQALEIFRTDGASQNEKNVMIDSLINCIESYIKNKVKQKH